MRLPLLTPETLSDDRRALYDDMRSGIEAHFTGFTSIAPDGALVGPWNPTLHWPKYGKPWWDYTKALGTDPLLPKPVREVAILVVGARFKARYELYAHVAVGEKVGLAETKIATIVAGQRPVDLTREEAVAYDVAFALASGGILPDATWRSAIETFGRDATAELLYLVAGYCLVSVILNGFDVPVPNPDGTSE